MSFLDQLKSQASELQNQRQIQQKSQTEQLAQTQQAIQLIFSYINDLARQLNIISPTGPVLSLLPRQPWPAMKLQDFRADARKKTLSNQTEVFDYVNLAWLILPEQKQSAGGNIKVNFLPDLERVEGRLRAGNIQYERREDRDLNNKLLAIRFEFDYESRGNIRAIANYDTACIDFRLTNVSDFGMVSASYPVSSINSKLLDELAKLILGKTSQFG